MTVTYVPKTDWKNKGEPGAVPVYAEDAIRWELGIAGASQDAGVALGAANGAVVKGSLTVSPKDYGALGDGSTDDTTAIQRALDEAFGSAGTVVLTSGTYAIAGTLVVGSGVSLAGQGATVIQTAALTPALRVDGEGVVVRDLRVQGLTADYVNASSVYNAVGINVSASSRSVRIENCSLLGMAGAGVTLADGADDIHVTGCTMTGAGPTHIISTSHNFSAGIRSLLKSGSWSAQFNDISGFAQGVVTSDEQSNYRVIGNRVHDIPGQHGFYLESATRGVVQGNVVWNTGLLGMKIQLGSTVAPDATDIVISGNVFTNAGDAGILLTNPQGGTPRLRRILVTGNVVTSVTSDGINANNCEGLLIAGNIVTAVRNGIYADQCAGVEVNNNTTTDTVRDGILISNSTDFTVRDNRVRNPGKGGVGGYENGLHIIGTCSEGTLSDNKASDDGATMRHGIYINGSTPDLTTMDFVDNIVLDAVDYGWRFNGTAQAARQFHGNYFEGGTAAMLAPPSNFVANPDTSGATLTGLEVEVNELKAALRAAGLIQS